MSSAWLDEFGSPGSAYRGKPFWAWNGRLEPEELRRQIRIMQRMGLGGFFMHSRVGLGTPYLTDEWFECIRACVEEAKALGMEAWLYDEDRWPSGAAGGLVTKDPRYRQRSLLLREVARPGDFKWDDDTLAVFVAKVNGSEARDVRRLAEGSKPKRLARGERLLVFSCLVTPESSWYNDATYLDVLNPEAVRAFIKTTHEAYAKRFGKEFGKSIPGIFTDEPNHGGRVTGMYDDCRAPWTDKLLALFNKRFGYDLTDHFVELFYDVDERPFTPTRLHYHQLVTEMFVDAFSRQIGEWCGKNGLLFTGHVLGEAMLSTQSHVVGSAMRFYEHMQAPGMDLLTEFNREYDTAKQVASVARQFDRKWRLTETYGCTGWAFPFAGHKALGDWQLALGINLRCQHLSWYTMEGQAKRDYPAGIFYQSPWWEVYGKVEDYFARVHAVMTRGREVRDVLVIHPIESAWTRIKKGWLDESATKDYDRTLSRLRDTLLAANLDFDYGDEDIMVRHAKAGRRRGAPRLTVGKADYRTVVVPPLVTMRSSTLRLLQTFRALGGLVVFAGDAPKYVDGEPSNTPATFAETCVRAPADGEALAEAVAEGGRRVSIEDAGGKQIAPTLYLLREDAEACYLFVCNTGHNYHELDVRVAGRRTLTDIPVRDRNLDFPDVRVRGFEGCEGAPTELDPETGEVFAAEAQRDGDGWAVRTSLPALGSRLFVVPKKNAATRLPKRPALVDGATSEIAPKAWEVSLSEANVLALDRPAGRIGKGRLGKPEEVLRFDRRCRDAVGARHRGGQMVQPWARVPNPDAKSVAVELRYDFCVEKVPSGELWLAIERPELYRMTLNGYELSADAEAGWWVDRSLRRIAVDPALLNVGKNEIVLTCDYEESHPGFEIIYLLGDFGVELRRSGPVVVAPPSELSVGDWVPQGLPFYSGSVSYATTLRPKLRRGERLVVRVADFRGAAARVFVDGREAGVLGWPPYEVDVTALVGRKKSVRLVVEVIGHRRNSHGPFHLADTCPPWTGPTEYVTESKAWVEAIQLVPCGLMSAPLAIVRRPPKKRPSKK